jgi:hypothetical protein
MGLFSSKKIINVSSTLYNMAGDENDRPDFLKGTVFGSVISNSPSISDSISKAYMNGPGLKQRQFFKYCEHNDIRGLPTATVVNNLPLDTNVVQAQIPPSVAPPAPTGLTLRCFAAEVTDGDFESWLERWILLNHPTRIGEDWLGEYEPNTNTFSVEFPNNDFFSWLNTDAPTYSPNNRYVVGKYVEYLESSEGAVVTGTTETVIVHPDVSGWSQTAANDTFDSVSLVRSRTTVLSYDNGDPDVTVEDAVDASVSAELPDGNFTYEREIYIGSSGIEVEGERQIRNISETHSIVGGFTNVVVTHTTLGSGVIETRTETTTGQQIAESYLTSLDTQGLYEGNQYGSEQIFIYQVGTGNAVLDGLVEDVDVSGLQQEFYPFMPLRIDNVSLKDPSYDSITGNGLYDEMAKAYKRGFGYQKSIGSLIDTVEENESIDDIDYAYLCFGISLNVKEEACRRYIFNFFERILPFQQGGSGSAMSDFQAQVAAYDEALTDLREWEANVASASEGGVYGDIPLRPELPALPVPPSNTIQLNEDELGFDLRLVWVHAEIDQFSGQFDIDSVTAGSQPAKKNEIVFRNGSDFTWQVRESYNNRDGEDERLVTSTIPSMQIYWQISDNAYRVMTIWGLVHYNYVYGGKAVVITSKEALEDNEESGFLVPLHYPTMMEMGIVDYTQMSTSNSHILFNSYTVTTQRWYERGIFRILLVIVAIIVAVIAFPSLFATGAGLLGGNIAIGTALGLSGTAALIAGVVANYIASILVAQVLQVVGTTFFGEKWGALFAAIASFALGTAISGLNLFSTEGLLGLGNALANGYAGWVQGDIAKMQEDLNDARNLYEERMEYINDLIADLSGGNGLNFNPIFLTERSGNGRGRNGSYLPETADEYIRRTTMTGSDIVELTHSMVYNFVDVAKILPRN